MGKQFKSTYQTNHSLLKQLFKTNNRFCVFNIYFVIEQYNSYSSNYTPWKFNFNLED